MTHFIPTWVSSRHDWVVPYLRVVSRDAAVHNGNITIKHSHRPVLVIRMKRETLLLFLTKHCFRLQWLHYYRYIGKLQTGEKRLSMERMLEIQLTRSMICHVSNTRWNTEYVCPVASDIVYRVMLVKGEGCGATRCNVTTLMDHIWWMVMIAPIIRGEVRLIARYTHQCRL